MANFRIDRMALRRVLGGRAEIVHADAAAKATGRIGVNAGRIWQYMTTAVYQSGDLPALATREALQNAVDAIRAAARARQIGPREGRFEVTWDASARALTWDDNGVGMDAPTIFGKFLSLGDSGKSAATSSGEAAGGFGVAKAVILGTSASFRWEMHTRDNRAVSESVDQEIAVYDAPHRLGTRLTIFDVSARFDSMWSQARGRHLDLLDRLREVLAANDLPDIELRLNGERVAPLFSRRGGARVATGSWGDNITVQVKAYRRAPGDRRGGYYVRLGGLFQFATSSRRGDLGADVVVDLATTIRPGERGYPLNAGRDALVYPTRDSFDELTREVERENESVADDRDAEVFDPESDDASEREGAAAMATLATEALQDPALRTALTKAAGGVSDFYAERRAAKPSAARQQESDAAAASPAEPEPPAGFALTDDLAAALADASGEPLPRSVRAALGRATAGTATADDAQVIDIAVAKAADRAVAPGGGGLVQMAPIVARAEAALAQVPGRVKRNPLGSLGGLRVSKKYDKAKARRFKQNFGRWLPHLLAWDATLRLIAKTADIRVGFRPGLILDETVNGMAAMSKSGGIVVYANPDRLAQIVKLHRERPLGIAAFLHGLAVHELTHIDGRMGEYHSEAFVSSRENLGRATGLLLEPIALLAQKLFELPETAEQQRLGSLRRDLARAGTKREALEAALREARRESARVARTCPCGNCGGKAQGRRGAVDLELLDLGFGTA